MSYNGQEKIIYNRRNLPMKKQKMMSVVCASALACICSLSVCAAPFDASYYAEQNPDVVAAIGSDAAALEQHYNMFGRMEGRAANATDKPVGLADFDAAYYAEQNPDVVAVVGNDVTALYTHYITIGQTEGRMPSASAASGKNSSSASEEENPYARFKPYGRSSAPGSASRKSGRSSSGHISSVSGNSVSGNN